MTEQEWLTEKCPVKLLDFLMVSGLDNLIDNRTFKALYVDCLPLYLLNSPDVTVDKLPNGLNYDALLKINVQRHLPLEDDPRADLIRCAVGNPWRPFADCRECADLSGGGHKPDCPMLQLMQWTIWRGGLITKMAQRIREESAFDKMPILADALEEAGCQHAALLAHCRSNVHGRGCWVLNLLG